MFHRLTLFNAFILLVFGLVSLQATTLSKQQADSFARKMAVISQAGTAPHAAGMKRTRVTETELNSWFAYRAKPLLPQGVADPRVTVVGNGKLIGTVIVDLAAVGKKHASGGMLDPWSLLGGRVPVNVSGILHTKDGAGRFELQQADISGLPVPMTGLQELVSYYSRTPANPTSVRLDDRFVLPANIRQIEVGEAQAVVVQ